MNTTKIINNKNKNMSKILRHMKKMDAQKYAKKNQIKKYEQNKYI